MSPIPFSKAGGPPFPSLLDAARHAASGALAAFAADGQPGGILAVDATCGNGNDTLFLAERLFALTAASRRDWVVLGLDVQEAALESAKALLHSCPGRDRVRLVLTGHEHLAALLDDYARSETDAGRAVPVTACVMYNLGFLPRSDKLVVTRTKSTLVSLEAAGAALSPGGLLIVHAYGGHAGGGEELAAVDAWCASLPYDGWLAARYAVVNKQRNPEALFLAQKRPRPRRPEHAGDT